MLLFSKKAHQFTPTKQSCTPRFGCHDLSVDGGYRGYTLSQEADGLHIHGAYGFVALYNLHTYSISVSQPADWAATYQEVMG
ncbi:MAG: hypothetical protein DHS20C10_07420 [marine bacterium B5-7]|nr:MAG: hypothetical protein DHS20C10_07420 [marine bacterium B5-7]